MKNFIILLLFFNTLLIHGQCVYDIILPAGNLITPLTESETWIKTADITIADENNIIKLDANPYSGFVELNPGFQSFPIERGAFIAQAFDGCDTSAPSRFISQSTNSALIDKNISIYPNPSKSIFYLNNKNMSGGMIEVFNILGVKIMQQAFTSNSISELNLENQASQLFLVKIISDGTIISKGIIKD